MQKPAYGQTRQDVVETVILDFRCSTNSNHILYRVFRQFRQAKLTPTPNLYEKLIGRLAELLLFILPLLTCHTFMY